MGAGLTATVDKETADPTDTKLFNLTVTDTGRDFTETFRNVSFSLTSSRRVDLVLAGSSTLVRAGTPLPTAAQGSATVTSGPATGGNDGDPITKDQVNDASGMQASKTGMYALEKADLFNLLVIPPYVGAGHVGERDIDDAVVTKALAYVKERRAVLILDAPTGWSARPSRRPGPRPRRTTGATTPRCTSPASTRPTPCTMGRSPSSRRRVRSPS